MKIFIRVDASTTIGIGHLFRTLVLAEGLRPVSHDIIFLCQDLSGLPVKRIMDLGFKLMFLPVVPSFEEELPFIENKMKLEKPDWVIVDHYQATERYYLSLAKRGVKVLAIDDLNHTRFPVDILLNQNINAMQHNYIGRPDTVKLLGPQYALIKAVYEQKKKEAKIRNLLKRVLVSMGGSDPDNQTLKVLKALILLERELEIDVILGPAYKYRTSIEKIVSQGRAKCLIHHDLDNLSDVMLRADLAIGAGGSSSLEMAVMKLPMIIMPVAENQIGIAKCFHEKGAAVNAGWFEDTTEDDLVGIINNISDEQLQEMSRIAAGLCEGTGVKSIVETMVSFAPVKK